MTAMRGSKVGASGPVLATAEYVHEMLRGHVVEVTDTAQEMRYG